MASPSFCAALLIPTIAKTRLLRLGDLPFGDERRLFRNPRALLGLPQMHALLVLGNPSGKITVNIIHPYTP